MNKDQSKILANAILEALADNKKVTRGLVEKIDENFNSIDERFNGIEKRLSSIEARLDILTDTTSVEFNKVDGHLVSIQEELEKINQATGYEEAISNLRLVSGGK